MITPGKKYKIVSSFAEDSNYFASKYGDPNPVITIEDEHEKIFGNHWSFGADRGNPGCLCYMIRLMQKACAPDMPGSGKVFYGHIGGTGELVNEKELEEIE
jgi:hypothetical protein